MKYAILSLIFSVTCYSQIVNGSFEAWDVPCSVDEPPQGWSNFTTFGGNTGGLEKLELGVCEYAVIAASEGSKYGEGLAQGLISGEGIGQMVHNFQIGAQYDLSFDYTGGYFIDQPELSQNAQWHLWIDMIDVSQTPPFYHYDHEWHTYHYTFTATATTHFIGLRTFAAQSGFYGTGVIDNVMLTPVLGVHDFAAVNVVLFNDPVTQVITLQAQRLLRNASLEIFDLLGNEVNSVRNINSNEISIERRNLAGGMYILRLIEDGRPIYTSKICFAR